MSVPESIKLKHLKHSSDLDLLRRGEVVRLVYRYNLWINQDTEQFAAYHGKSEAGQMQFVSHQNNSRDISVCMSKKEKIGVEGIFVVVREDSSVMQYITPDVREYLSFRETLELSGLLNTSL